MFQKITLSFPHYRYLKINVYPFLNSFDDNDTITVYTDYPKMTSPVEITIQEAKQMIELILRDKYYYKEVAGVLNQLCRLSDEKT